MKYHCNQRPSRPFKFLFLLFFSLPTKRCWNQWSGSPRYYAALRTFAIIVSKNLKCLESPSNNLLITTNTAYTLISNKKFKTLNNLRFTIVQLTCQCRYFWLGRVILKTGALVRSHKVKPTCHWRHQHRKQSMNVKLRFA